MSRPTLLAIETLIMIGPYLTNSGKFLDAWALFGVTIRLAHSIGCELQILFSLMVRSLTVDQYIAIQIAWIQHHLLKRAPFVSPCGGGCYIWTSSIQ